MSERGLTLVGGGRSFGGGGVETSENTESGWPPRQHAAIFMPGVDPRHVSQRREGGEYNTRKGNKPARVLTFGRFLGFEPLATSETVESLTVGVSIANRKAAT